MLKEVGTNKEYIDLFIRKKLENCRFIDLVDRAFDYKNYYIASLLHRFDIDKEVLEFLSESECPYIKKSVASHKNTSLKVLKRLSRDKDFEVKECVASNKNTSIELLKKISNDKEYQVRHYAIKNIESRRK